MLGWILALALQDVVTYRLTVVGGTGSGTYQCGQLVPIVGDAKKGRDVFDIWFAGWDGDTTIERRHGRKAKLTMPCKDVTVEARFTAPPPRRSFWKRLGGGQ